MWRQLIRLMVLVIFGIGRSHGDSCPPLTPPTTKTCPDGLVIDTGASCPTQSTPPPPTNNNPPPTENNPTPPSGNDNDNNNPPSGGSAAVMVEEAAADLAHQVQVPCNSP